MKHTPEPWWIDDDGFIASGHGDDYVTVADPCCSDIDPDDREANAERIVACVNACEGIADLSAIEDMREALALAEATIERLNRHNSADGTLHVIRAALDKAEGR